MKTLRLRTTFLVPATCAVAMIMTSPLGAELALAKETGAVYGGTTSQRMPVIVEVSRDGRRIKRAVGAITSKCGSGGSYTVPSIWRSVRIAKNGSFKAVYKDTFSDMAVTESFVGRFNRSRTRLSGTWRSKTTFHEPDGTTDVCDSGRLKVSARQ